MTEMMEKRNQRLREQLDARIALRPPSVFDPVSARLAEHLGLPVGLLGGSVASALILGAPDLALLTQTELVDQVRRTTSVGSLSLMVDGDHGYGNSLNVWRTVRELEQAGASGIFLEETVLPAPFGATRLALIDLVEMERKVAAATHARQRSSTVIVARTDALRTREDRSKAVEDTRARVSAYARAGADAILLIGVQEIGDVLAVRDVTDLPVLVGSPLPESVSDEALREAGVSMVMRGHTPFVELVRSLYVSLSSYLPQSDGTRVDVPEAADLLRIVTGADSYDRLREQFLEEPR